MNRQTDTVSWPVFLKRFFLFYVAPVTVILWTMITASSLR